MRDWFLGVVVEGRVVAGSDSGSGSGGEDYRVFSMHDRYGTGFQGICTLLELLLDSCKVCCF